MNALQAIQKIRIALGIEKFEAVATLEDGVTKVHVDGEFAPGEQLHVVAEDGSFVPAPEGTHTTEDGMMITVDAAGVITTVEEKAAEALEEEVKVEEETKEEVKMEEETEEEGTEVSVEVAPEMVNQVIEALMPIIEQVKELETEMKKMQASFAKFSNEPAAKPVRNTFNQVASNSTLESRLETIASLRKKK